MWIKKKCLHAGSQFGVVLGICRLLYPNFVMRYKFHNKLYHQLPLPPPGKMQLFRTCLHISERNSKSSHATLVQNYCHNIFLLSRIITSRYASKRHGSCLMIMKGKIMDIHECWHFTIFREMCGWIKASSVCSLIIWKRRDIRKKVRIVVYANSFHLTLLF